MKRILYSNWLPEQARRAHFAHSGLSTLIPRKKKIAWRGLEKFVIFEPAMQWKKAAADSQSKEKRNDSRGFIVLQTQLTFPPGFHNDQVILDS